MAGHGEFLATIRGGDRRKSLEALRDRLAGELTQAVGRDVAPIASRLQDVLRELDEMPNTTEETPMTEIERKRAARRANATDL